MRFIFDLDGTVVDSSHRQGDGSLNDWRRLNTVGNIMRDGLLPLAGKMQTAIQDGLDIWVCTSRVMGKADFAFLRLQNLLPNGGPVIHRIGENDQRPCGELKLAKLRGYAAGMGITWAQFAHDSIMFDDSLDVQKTLRGAGIRVIDPVQFNSYIQNKVA
jgi:hypothetical protein